MGVDGERGFESLSGTGYGFLGGGETRWGKQKRCVCMSVCERKREIERKRKRERKRDRTNFFLREVQM